ncbi:tRNA uridine-5-carboxymethylaminomethyl(34) synthesis GTPase MnmE [Pseudogracilibacillus auburnensis]|uniref:tRNA uridine-5-carboxymethylaminomethyl(34) synthesis GTPase MnmE n=1 Tax=Pseudogracilibacillus auburnensis TaxID=1494959 RepID=UPI001A95BD30|nr:tRNA uridine-5-carboxymethylaminomethyl(34) synthesis GTPase MnmE [Pseudogracilibacillus auburnensis]MBO1004167.1 tRNA uridine-5-carboxymethylaminomethyl(34) synthesis GTPase MnmE [Pseudogracilibacillus auburnensis]
MEIDTIAAISTPVGEGAISIVRLSGPDSIQMANQLFKGKHLMEAKSHTMHYGKIVDPTSEEIADEVIVSIMRAPKTFTCEDVVEINCHGGLIAVQRILEMVLEQGARLADPGEFTKRAFLNGRIDLSQAEAVMDVIQSKTNKAMNVALNQLDGKLSRLIRKLRQELIETIAHVEVNIDYPEYDDVEEMSHELMQIKTKYVEGEIKKLLQVAEQGKILREGIKTAIIGRPNVGKSSLMNSLVQEERAIVTDIPGTTRDVIEEYVNVRGIPLKLIDTAGIRETKDIVEKIGVERSRKMLQEADLVLFMLNNNEMLTDDDRMIFESLEQLNYIVIINKVDLERKIEMEEIMKLCKGAIISTSLINDQGSTELETALSTMFFSNELSSDEVTYVSNIRHISLLKQAKASLDDAQHALALNMPLDIVQIDVTRTWELLGEIIGDTASESLIDQLFSQFCLGK